MSNILQTLKPDVVVLCETKATNAFMANFFEKERYVPVIKPRVSTNSGGIVIAVRMALSKCFTESTSSVYDNICSAMLKSSGRSLKIIAAYGPQETAKKECREEFYEELAIELKSGEDQGCYPFVIGDFNAKMLKDDLGNIAALSPNGELLMDLMSNHSLVAA